MIFNQLWNMNTKKDQAQYEGQGSCDKYALIYPFNPENKDTCGGAS